MYTQQHVDSIHKQIRKRSIALLIATLFVIAIIVVSIIKRLEWLTNLSTILGIGSLIFSYDRCITPLRKYAAHLKNCTAGITHEVDVVFDGFSPDLSVVDGVRFFAMNTLEQKGDKQFDRLFYWDAELPKPDLKQGEPIRVTYHDRQIAQLEKI